MGRFLKENRLGVMQSLIASVLFLLIIEPLIHIVRDMLSKGLAALVDYFYYSCSRADGIIFLSTIAMYAVVYFVVKIILDMCKNIFSESHKKKERTKELKSQPQENAVDQIDQIVKLSMDLEKSIKREKRLDLTLRGMSIVCIIIYVLFFLNITIYQCFPVAVKASFDRCITQITPYVENEKIEILQSDWVCMETKEDYDVIVEEINRIQEEHNLK